MLIELIHAVQRSIVLETAGLVTSSECRTKEDQRRYTEKGLQDEDSLGDQVRSKANKSPKLEAENSRE